MTAPDSQVAPELAELLKRLRDGLRGVTDGPYHVHEWDGVLKRTDIRDAQNRDVMEVPWDRGTGCSAHRDAAFFALCSPENIRTVLDRLSALLAEREGKDAEIERLTKERDEARAERDEAISILRNHHKWQCEIGVVSFAHEDGPVELDLSAEYGDSTLCADTLKVLS